MKASRDHMRPDHPASKGLLSCGAMLGAGMFLAGCLATAKPRSEAPPAAPARIKDSVGEKAAAQRSASGGLKLEEEDERWGIEAAKERKRRSDGDVNSGGKPVPTGPVDIRAP